MIFNKIFAVSVLAFVSVQCQVFTVPYRQPAIVASPTCIPNPPAPIVSPPPTYQYPAPPYPCSAPPCPYSAPPCPYSAPLVPTVVVNPPVGALEPVVTTCGNIAEVPVPICPPVPVDIPVTPFGLPGLPAMSPLSNPFLPAASPVSALSLCSSCLPPPNTCSRCQYLKKIPIPPPCI